VNGTKARGPAAPSPNGTGWLASQSPASRAYFAVMMIAGSIALAGAAFHPDWASDWTRTPWATIVGWSVLGVLTSLSVALQLRKVADGAATVTMRDVWTLSALFIWGLPAALTVNLILVLFAEAVTKTRVEGRPLVPARAGFNAAATSLALVAAWAGTAQLGDSWWAWLVAGIVFETVTVAAVELHLFLNRSPRRLSQALLVLAMMCLTEVPLAVVLDLTWAQAPLLTLLLAVPMFVTAAGLQYILEFIELRDLVSTDSRTGLLTPAAWRDATEKLVRTQQVAILMGDLDGFKTLNDTYGHLVGDEILSQVGDILISSIRPVDLACRWGGEEFVLVLVGTSVRDAVLVAERIRARVAAEARHDGAAVTISIGVAGCPATGGAQVAQALTTTMGLADEALYRAKNEGRNRVAAIDSDPR
jgi:diguanylate cyclase (GGDEF)-like protein